MMSTLLAGLGSPTGSRPAAPMIISRDAFCRSFFFSLISWGLAHSSSGRKPFAAAMMTRPTENPPNDGEAVLQYARGFISLLKRESALLGDISNQPAELCALRTAIASLSCDLQRNRQRRSHRCRS